MILLLDHDDSFVHILAGYCRELGADTAVRRATDLTLDAIRAMAPSRIILSPGPRTPRECPLAIEVIHALGPATPILGVCLGHQCIAAAYGGIVRRAASPRHGMTSPIGHDGLGVLRGLPSPFSATRYHSLVADRASLPDVLAVSATAMDDGEVMGLRHREHPVEGVQFHPESVLTERGRELVRNFLDSSPSP